MSKKKKQEHSVYDKALEIHLTQCLDTLHYSKPVTLEQALNLRRVWFAAHMLGMIQGAASACGDRDAAAAMPAINFAHDVFRRTIDTEFEREVAVLYRKHLNEHRKSKAND